MGGPSRELQCPRSPALGQEPLPRLVLLGHKPGEQGTRSCRFSAGRAWHTGHSHEHWLRDCLGTEVAAESRGGWGPSPFLSSGRTGSRSKARRSQALPQPAAGRKGPPRRCRAAGASGQRESPPAVSPFQAGPLQALRHPSPSRTVSGVRPYLDCVQRPRPRGRSSLLHMGPPGSSGQPGSRTSRLGTAGSPPATWPQGGPGESLQVHSLWPPPPGGPPDGGLWWSVSASRARSRSVHSASQTSDCEIGRAHV